MASGCAVLFLRMRVQKPRVSLSRQSDSRQGGQEIEWNTVGIEGVLRSVVARSKRHRSGVVINGPSSATYSDNLSPLSQNDRMNVIGLCGRKCRPCTGWRRCSGLRQRRSGQRCLDLHIEIRSSFKISERFADCGSNIFRFSLIYFALSF